jgi:hypothetical protein
METVMRMMSRFAMYGLLAVAGVLSIARPASAGPLPAAALVANGEATVIEVGRRWYRGYTDDFYYPPEYDLPPPPPVRGYRYGPPPPVVVYEPPVYGWLALPPPPSSCGKYRYWNGVRCADARYDPPYIGPRW